MIVRVAFSIVFYFCVLVFMLFVSIIMCCSCCLRIVY